MLSHDQASRWLRLPYAVTYRSSQGITARDKRVMIMSMDKPMCELRSLIVGSSRVTDDRLLHAPTSVQEKELLSQCPLVSEPPARTPSEPADSDDSDDEP